MQTSGGRCERPGSTPGPHSTDGHRWLSLLAAKAACALVLAPRGGLYVAAAQYLVRQFPRDLFGHEDATLPDLTWARDALASQTHELWVFWRGFNLSCLTRDL